MSLKRRSRLAALCAAVALAAPTAASANQVTKWNEIALGTISAQPPIASAPNATMVFAAMVQGAVYGAVNAVDRHGRPYLINRSFPHGSDDAAAATAAFRVLAALFPAQRASLQAAYDASLAAVADGPSKDIGIAVGTMAADAMIAQGHDGRTVIGCTFGSGLPGVWQPLAGPTGPLCDPSAWVKDAKPFLVKRATRFQSAGPYALTSAQYAADLNEVKSIGAFDSTTRSSEQTHAAVFWQTNPSPSYNAVARRFVDQFSLDVSDSARLFALLDLSMADAIITTWHDKYSYNFWRPITAIRHADGDGNPNTAADPVWTPLFDPSLLPAAGGVGPALITPPYPEAPSGASAAASAAMHALASFFGTDEMAFYATSSRFPGEQRPFNRFSDLTAEVLDARVWAGIHFRHSDVQAEKIGHDVGSYIDTHWFSAAH
jgi:hypothetical protein